MATFEQERQRRERVGITTDDLVRRSIESTEVLVYDGEKFDVTKVTHRKWVTFPYTLRDAGGYGDPIKGARRVRIIRVAIHEHRFIVKPEGA